MFNTFFSSTCLARQIWMSFFFKSGFLLKVFFFLPLLGIAGSARDSANTFKPYLLSNHPLTIFLSRINHNFNWNPEQGRTIQFTLSRGNVWLPYAQSKLVTQENEQQYLSNYVWHERNYEMERQNINDYQTRSLDADGLFSTYSLQWKERLTRKFDVGVNLRFGQLSAGRVPYSLLTSDRFIEWFHSNLIGGEDPFGRKSRPYDLAALSYQDTNGQNLSLTQGDLFFGEFSADWSYYFSNDFWGVRPVFTINTGISQLKRTFLFNPGAASSFIKRFYFRRNHLEIGFAGGVMFPGVLQRLPVEINNNRYLASFECNAAYVVQMKKSSWVFGVNYHLQSALMKSEEKDFYVIESLGISSHGHYAMSHLNRPLQGWSFSLTYQRGNTAISAFLREDALVDNAPDVQVGWAIYYRM